MLEFPAVFQSAGYVPCIFCLALVCVISSVCATLLCDAMARMPSNDSFEKRIEFSDLFLHFLGPKWFVVTQVAFYLCLLSQNVAAIVSTAQVLDSLMASFIIGRTYALQLSPEVTIIRWSDSDCAADNIGACVPFSSYSDSLIVSEGYILCSILFMHFGLLNLEENIFMQIVSFGALVIITCAFLVCFCFEGDAMTDQSSSEWSGTQRVPAFGHIWRDCLGVVIFNFAFCVTIPSWVNEKLPGVNINKVIWSSTISSTLLYAAVGWLGGRAFSDVPDNMLLLLGSRGAVDSITRFLSLLFGLTIIGLGIPIFCILMRYNLVVGGVCNNEGGLFFGGIFPWLISWLVYQGHGVLELLSWTGLILNGFIDFFCPALVAFVAARSAFISLNNNLLPSVHASFIERYSGGKVPPTIVNALPQGLQEHHEMFAIALGATILAVVGVGMTLKLAGAINSD